MKNRLLKLASMLLLAAPWLASAQIGPQPNYFWTRCIASASNEIAYGIAAANDGGVYVGGAFNGEMAIQGQVLTPRGAADAFLAKFDALGNKVWAQSFGNTGPDSIVKLAVDTQGNVIAVGSFVTSIALGTNTLTSQGQDSIIFVAKFDSSGGVLWAKRIFGFGSVFPSGAGVDTNGNVYVSGIGRREIGVDSEVLLPQDGSLNRIDMFV